MFSKLLSLAALAAVANAEHWIFGGSKLIVQTRLDPVVNQGTVSSSHGLTCLYLSALFRLDRTSMRLLVQAASRTLMMRTT